MPIDYTSVDEVKQEFITQLSTSLEPALAKMITWSSRMIDRKCNRQRGFSTSTGDETLTLDGPPGARWQGLPLVGTDYYSFTFNPRVDIASLTTLKLALNSVAASSGTYTTISTVDWFLQPTNRPPGHPAAYIEVATSPNGTYASSTEPYTAFVPGLRTVTMIGKFGWNCTSVDSTNFPQEIRLVAVEVAVKAWRTRETGYSNTFGVSEVGVATVERQLSPFARDVIDHYTRPAVF